MSRPPLKKGAYGNDVTTLQHHLNARRRRKIRVDGDFGNETEAAVRNFQRRNRLAPDGEVGRYTWGLLDLRIGVVVVETRHHKHHHHHHHHHHKHHEPTYRQPPYRLLDTQLRPPVMPGVNPGGPDYDAPSQAPPPGVAALGDAGGGSSKDDADDKPNFILNFQLGLGGSGNWDSGDSKHDRLWHPEGAVNGTLSMAFTFRTASKGTHLEAGAGPVVTASSTQPHLTTALSFTVAAVDVVEITRWPHLHLLSPAIQGSYTLSAFGNDSAWGLGIGNQISYDLDDKGMWSFYFAPQLNVNFLATVDAYNHHRTTFSASGIFGVSLNVGKDGKGFKLSDLLSW